MAPQEAIFSPNAEKEIKKLSTEDQRFIIGVIEKWCCGELSPEIEKIKTQPDFFRARFGRFRVIYYPLNKKRVVLLLIRDRKEAYRNLVDLHAKLGTAMRKIRAVGATR